MAKGQKRSNKEIKKPKADKAPKAPVSAEAALGKGLLEKAGKAKKGKK